MERVLVIGFIECFDRSEEKAYKEKIYTYFQIFPKIFPLPELGYRRQKLEKAVASK